MMFDYYLSLKTKRSSYLLTPEWSFIISHSWLFGTKLWTFIIPIATTEITTEDSYLILFVSEQAIQWHHFQGLWHKVVAGNSELSENFQLRISGSLEALLLHGWWKSPSSTILWCIHNKFPHFHYNQIDTSIERKFTYAVYMQCFSRREGFFL